MYREYFKYIREHRKNISLACDFWEKQLPNMFNNSYHTKKDKKELKRLLLKIKLFHDLDKYLPSSFIPYAKWFYGEYGVNMKDEDLIIIINGEKHINGMKYMYLCECESNFKKAADKHCKENRHHWNYWAGKDIQIPYKYIIEMIVDWTAMGYKFNNSPQDYYLKNYNKIKMDRDSRFILEKNLGLLFYKRPICDCDAVYWMTIKELKFYIKDSDNTLDDILESACARICYNDYDI